MHATNGPMGRTQFLSDGDLSSEWRIVLAHGAGAPMDSPWMSALAGGLARRGLGVLRFEFPYMRRRREGGGRRPPDPQAVLIAAFRDAIAELGGAAGLFIGGKSMGGRMASLCADELGVRGLVCLGYPFHPVGQPEKTRTAHLAALRTPTLIVQGTRDELGSLEDVAAYRLSPSIRIAWMKDGDHSFKPRKASGRSVEQAREESIAAITAFVTRMSSMGS
jgi:predicted alpha/beta-hydrolase family hydrolase